MGISSTVVAALIAIAFIFNSSLSYPIDALPTHCKRNEFVYLSARMYKQVEGNLTKDAGKILSLCADKRQEPFGKFMYRYGAIGRVEMEQSATNLNKFGLSQQSDSGSHAGMRSIRFSKGKYIYEVGEGMGMTLGIRLSVYESGKRVLDFISDNYYESGAIRINFEKASSPIFKLVKPINPW